MPAVKFFALAMRVICYDGVITARAEQEAREQRTKADKAEQRGRLAVEAEVVEVATTQRSYLHDALM